MVVLGESLFFVPEIVGKWVVVNVREGKGDKKVKGKGIYTSS